MPTLAAIAFVLGIFVGVIVVRSLQVLNDDNPQPAQTENNSRRNIVPTDGTFYDTEYVNEVYEIFEETYLGSTDLDADTATHGMVKGLIESLDDKYTYFLDPEDASAYYEQASGDFEGVGIILEFQENYTYVETVLKEHPAEAAGVLPGDVIIKVDEEDVEGKFPAQVAQLIRGEKGTEVILTVVRLSNGIGEEMEIPITRDRIEIDNVMWEEIDKDTVLVEIIQFSDISAAKFNESWDKVVKEIEDSGKNYDNVIVDLRNNPGGYVFSVRYVLEEFLSRGDILLQERSKTMSENVYRDNREGAFEDENVYVLVNEGSASASEIFAGAIQDHERGEVVGMPTVGKGVEQEVHELDDNSLLFIVFQRWLTPNGNQISEENPIQPDYEVDFTEEDFRSNDDPQLDKVLELIKE